MVKEKGQNDKQRSTKHTYRTKDRVIRTPLKTGYENYPFGIFKHSLIQHASCGIVTERNMNEV
jgi:hypothetical protein